jgi:uncharacterized protein YndB with AHSA1/START domain
VPARDSNTMTASEQDLVITRVFDAPRKLVWEAWTDPEKLKHWSAPKGFTLPVSEGDLRPGGKWRACMISPDGKELWLSGEYREIVEPSRLVFTHAWDNERKPGPETLVTVTLTERGNKTEMTFRQSGFDSAESRQGHSEGWNECFDLLDDLLHSR